jgi:hypothetical protein
MSFSEEFKNNCKKNLRGQALIDIIENKLKNDGSQIIFNIPNEFKEDIETLKTLKKALDESGLCEVIMKNNSCLGNTIKFAPKYMYFFYKIALNNSSEYYQNYYVNDLTKVDGIVITV